MKYKLIIFLWFILSISNTNSIELNDVFSCVVNGNIRFILNFLNAGNNIDLTNSFGSTLLNKASSENQINILEMLIQRGADVNAADASDATPLFNAVCWSSYPKIVRLLLENGANPNGTKRNNPFKHLISSRQSNIDMVKLFLKHGADPRLLDDYGQDNEIKKLLEEQAQRLNIEDQQKKDEATAEPK